MLNSFLMKLFKNPTLWVLLWFMFIGVIAACNAQMTPMHEAAIEIAESSVAPQRAVPVPQFYTYNPQQMYVYNVPVTATRPVPQPQRYYMYNTDGTFTTFTINYEVIPMTPYIFVQ